MQATHAIEEATRPLWLGRMPDAWGDVLRTVQADDARDAAAMVAAAGLDWTIEQHPLPRLLGGRRGCVGVRRGPRRG